MMNRAIVLTLLVAAVSAAPDNGWSWGTEEKKIEEPADVVSVVEVSAEEQGRAIRGQFSQQSSRVVEIPASDFNEPLPLEPHSISRPREQRGEISAPVHVALEGVTDEAQDPNREARFLGISDTLCDWGVGISCDNKIKKKGHGYRPSINTQYGVPSTHYSTYETYSAPSYPNNFNNQQHKPKGHKKKGGSGVSDLLTGFLNSYSKPKADKYAPSKLPTYIPPSPPRGGYEVPLYVAKPAYSPPTYNTPNTYISPRPSYIAPKPTYSASKPIYSAPNPTYSIPKPVEHVYHKPSYVESSYSAPVITSLKPKYVHTPARVTTVYTQTVSPVEATKVQHLHSHTHVYHGAQIIKPGDTGYSSSNHGSSGHFQKKSDSDSNILSTNGDSFGSGTSFVSSTSGSISSGSSVNGFLSNPLEVSSSSNINHNINPFDAKTTQNFGNNDNTGFSSHTQFINNNQNSYIQSDGFQADRFQPSRTEFGFKPSLTIEDMINQNQIVNHFSRTIYRSDCHCVSEQFCSIENVVLGQRDLSNVIDARNRQSDVYSNSTTLDEDSSENTTDTGSDRLGRSFDFGDIVDDEEITNSTDAPDYEYYETESPTTESSTNVPEVSRRRRDTNEGKTEEAYSDVQGRQLSGYTPGPHGCGAGTVCCRRPVYSPARTLPVCGISNDENIHGRIKTKNQGTGRAGFAEYPWQAAILRRSGGEMVYVCGASLIDEQYLITAAHCINNVEFNTLKIRVGEWDVRDKTEFYPHVESQVSGVYIHPEFYEGNLENDIAIIRVADRIDYSKYPHISPVCLPPSRTDFTGQVCTITGWGKDGWGSEGEFQAILKETDVPVMNTDVCQQILRTTKLGASYTLHQGMMCAGGEENKDACKGDGGGPLVCRGSAGEYQLAGVVSWGIGCGERGIPGVYVDVPHYVDWINSITKS